jgi:hypothetical protein
MIYKYKKLLERFKNILYCVHEDTYSDFKADKYVTYYTVTSDDNFITLEFDFSNAFDDVNYIKGEPTYVPYGSTSTMYDDGIELSLNTLDNVEIIFSYYDSDSDSDSFTVLTEEEVCNHLVAKGIPSGEVKEILECIKKKLLSDSEEAFLDWYSYYAQRM